LYLGGVFGLLEHGPEVVRLRLQQERVRLALPACPRGSANAAKKSNPIRVKNYNIKQNKNNELRINN
jgi:predicted component of type VI protein secretion system